MSKPSIIAFLVSAVIFCASAFADDTCTLLADNGEVWLRVYQEVGNGQKGSLIYDGHLDKGQTRQIQDKNGRIRYDYKVVANDSYHGDVGAWCHNSDTVKVP